MAFRLLAFSKSDDHHEKHPHQQIIEGKIRCWLKWIAQQRFMGNMLKMLDCGTRFLKRPKSLKYILSRTKNTQLPVSLSSSSLKHKTHRTSAGVQQLWSRKSGPWDTVETVWLWTKNLTVNLIFCIHAIRDGGWGFHNKPQRALKSNVSRLKLSGSFPRRIHISWSQSRLCQVRGRGDRSMRRVVNRRKETHQLANRDWGCYPVWATERNWP